jgi:hypothetical protein
VSHAVLPYEVTQPRMAPVVAVDHRATEAFPCQGLSPIRIATLSLFGLGMIFLNKLGSAGNALFFAIIAVMMLRSPLTAIMGMNLGLLGLVANVAFVTKTAVWTLSRFLNLFVFAGRFALAEGDHRWMRSPPYLWLTAFCVVAALCSIVGGYYVHISLLKLISFWVATTGFFAAIHVIRRSRVDTTEWFIAQTLTVCGMAVLSLALGVGANFKEYADLRGYHNLAFYHSQTMGPGAAFLTVYCSCVFLFAGHRNRWICLPIIGFLLYCLSLTASRTGAGALILGLAAALWGAVAWGGNRVKRPRLNISRSVMVAAIVGALVVAGGIDLATGGRISRRLGGFAAKTSGEVESVSFEAAIASRQGVAQQSWEVFKTSPVTGIGFQVAYGEYFEKNATLFSAPVEKGFLPTALLEEVGVLGTTVFVGFLLSMFLQLYRERNIPGMAMFVTHLASNLGEASYFAVAGQGGYGWVMFVAAVVLGDRCTVPRLSLGRWPGFAPR